MKNNLLLILILLIALSIVACSSIYRLPPKQQWQNWVKDYDKDRRSENGWLSLVGLYWLDEGKNTLGSVKGNKHRFPNDTPANWGTITINDNSIDFTRLSNEVRIDDNNIESQALELDKTIISFGPYSFFIIKREQRYAIRLKNSNSQYLTNFKDSNFYPYSEQLVVPARLIKNKTPKKIKIATVYGTVRDNDSAGVLEFEYAGKTLHLEAVSYGDEEPMTLMFTDETSEESTYGAGRYLEVKWPKDGEMTTIDFNYAYNPPCSITEFATCPLPPRQNRLNVAIEAGELFSGH